MPGGRISRSSEKAEAFLPCGELQNTGQMVQDFDDTLYPTIVEVKNRIWKTLFMFDCHVNIHVDVC